MLGTEVRPVAGGWWVEDQLVAVTGTAAQHQVLCLLLWCNDTVWCHHTCCHTVILSYWDNSSKYSIRGWQWGSAAGSAAAADNPAIRGESHPCLLQTELSRYSTHDTIRLTPDHGANEWFHTSYSSHNGVVQAPVWMRPVSAMIHCRSVSSPARQSTSTVHLMVTSRKGRLLIITTQHQEGFLITAKRWA